MKHKLEKNKGITLIALIVTIIVLLILAGVTISAITSNESAMNKGVEARVKNDQGAELDAIKLAVVGALTDADYTLKLNVDTLKEGLRDLIQEDVDTAIDANATEWTVTGITGVQYRITNDGVVTVVSGISISPSAIKVAKTNEENQTTTITATISKDMEYSTVTWGSSNTSVATISGTGASATVNILAKGTTTITASIPSVETPAQCSLKVVDTMANATVSAISVDVGETKAITITNADEIEDIESCSVATVTPEGGTETTVASVAKNGTTGAWEVTGVAVPTIPANAESVNTTLTVTGKSGTTKEVGVTVKKPDPPKRGDYIILNPDRAITGVGPANTNNTSNTSNEDDWMVLYNGMNETSDNDKKGLFVIMSNYLPNDYKANDNDTDSVVKLAGLETYGKYAVKSSIDANDLVSKLKPTDDTSNAALAWKSLILSEILETYPSTKVYGGITLGVMNKIVKLQGANVYYIPWSSTYQNTRGYWLATAYPNNEYNNYVRYDSKTNMGDRTYYHNDVGVLPVVILPQDVELTKNANGVWEVVIPQTGT